MLAAWREFKRGKGRKPDVRRFDFTLEEHLLELHASLRKKTYTPEPYASFYVSDPKLRHIHKATVRDRVVHQAVFRVLYPLFDKTFIHDSCSCRVGKGTHRGVRQLARYLRKVSKNYHAPAYALKCDVRKFFYSIDHSILLTILEKRVHDKDARWLLRVIIKSYESGPGKGLPLGNVTSQLFANVYMNEFDQWAKHKLKARYYLRYCDDFIILDKNCERLKSAVSEISDLLSKKLRLSLHPNKVSIKKVSQGVDFLGYIILPHATMVRAATKRRILRKVSFKNLSSYLGVLHHANARKFRKKILEVAIDI